MVNIILKHRKSPVSFSNLLEDNFQRLTLVGNRFLTQGTFVKCDFLDNLSFLVDSKTLTSVEWFQYLKDSGVKAFTYSQSWSSTDWLAIQTPPPVPYGVLALQILSEVRYFKYDMFDYSKGQQPPEEITLKEITGVVAWPKSTYAEVRRELTIALSGYIDYCDQVKDHFAPRDRPNNSDFKLLAAKLEESPENFYSCYLLKVKDALISNLKQHMGKTQFARFKKDHSPEHVRQSALNFYLQNDLFGLYEQLGMPPNLIQLAYLIQNTYLTSPELAQLELKSHFHDDHVPTYLFSPEYASPAGRLSVALVSARNLIANWV